VPVDAVSMSKSILQVCCVCFYVIIILPESVLSNRGAIAL
jgi:hypothetical protein